ncbi:hypothetical protein BDY17DRAFT_195275 [Neohortaea acidophila]|uniref:SnoaL-like domain-containing protein n=1 Tax=Neohortaea acidophila TaxID=245834 RepID=A0A6A6PKZ7_9PEZI|nr:uncharacterized protein BDY17DRAFT_195275 [Neohortaea acidophila]KAF2480595.1 hypothetical protein BDY17DRAFT_195275 [Neohortaea acidophila]
MGDSLYDRLAATAKAHIDGMRPKTPGTNQDNADALLANCAPTFRMSWGPAYYISTTPNLQGERTGEEFAAHLRLMAPAFQKWAIDITNMCVDVKTRTAVVRADFHMVPRGGEEVVQDLILWMVMDESGEKVVRCTEFVDAAATVELGVRLKAGTGRDLVNE